VRAALAEAAPDASAQAAVLGTTAPVAKRAAEDASPTPTPTPTPPPPADADAPAALHAAPDAQAAADAAAARLRDASGAVAKAKPAAGAPGGAPMDTRTIHVIVTADSSPYLQWQMRVCYYWYLKAAAARGSSFAAFTRILHTGKPDDLVADVPTVVVPEGPRPDSGGPPIQRPAAVIAWLQAAPPVEDYVMMLEPDHVILRPLALGSLARGRPLAFYFTYVNFADHAEALAPHLAAAGCAEADAQRTGNSPSLMHRDDLAAIAPGWRDMSIALHADAAVREAVGWVGEMYGFGLAACAAKLVFTLQAQELMLHPPFDTVVGEASLIHYTYGTELMANGTVADPNKARRGGVACCMALARVAYPSCCAQVPKEQRVWAFDKRCARGVLRPSRCAASADTVARSRPVQILPAGLPGGAHHGAARGRARLRGALGGRHQRGAGRARPGARSQGRGGGRQGRSQGRGGRRQAARAPRGAQSQGGRRRRAVTIAPRACYRMR
jgi:hypothetical protein